MMPIYTFILGMGHARYHMYARYVQIWDFTHTETCDMEHLNWYAP